METKLAKLSASTEADQSLDRMLEKLNTGFTGGRVTKVDLTSWIIRYFETHDVDSCVEKIRKDHFDKVAYMESVLKEMKKARTTGEPIPDLETILAPLVASQNADALRTRGASKKGKELPGAVIEPKPAAS